MVRKATLSYGENEDQFEITIDNIPIEKLPKLGAKIRTRIKTTPKFEYLKLNIGNITIYFLSERTP